MKLAMMSGHGGQPRVPTVPIFPVQDHPSLPIADTQGLPSPYRPDRDRIPLMSIFGSPCSSLVSGRHAEASAPGAFS